MRLPTTRRLIGRLLPPITRSFHNRLNLPTLRLGLLREDPLQALRWSLFRRLWRDRRLLRLLLLQLRRISSRIVRGGAKKIGEGTLSHAGPLITPTHC
jgi:hypothetical protein